MQIDTQSLKERLQEQMTKADEQQRRIRGQLSDLSDQESQLREKLGAVEELEKMVRSLDMDSEDAPAGLSPTVVPAAPVDTPQPDTPVHAPGITERLLLEPPGLEAAEEVVPWGEREGGIL